VLAAFDRIPVCPERHGPQVAYGITPAILDIVLLEIAAALDRWVQNGKEPKSCSGGIRSLSRHRSSAHCKA
jgi:hypothetical protein